MLSEITKITIPVFLSMNLIYPNWISPGIIHIINIPWLYCTDQTGVLMHLALSLYKKSENIIFLMVFKIDNLKVESFPKFTSISGIECRQQDQCQFNESCLAVKSHQANGRLNVKHILAL